MKYLLLVSYIFLIASHQSKSKESIKDIIGFDGFAPYNCGITVLRLLVSGDDSSMFSKDTRSNLFKATELLSYQELSLADIKNFLEIGGCRVSGESQTGEAISKANGVQWKIVHMKAPSGRGHYMLAIFDKTSGKLSKLSDGLLDYENLEKVMENGYKITGYVLLVNAPVAVEMDKKIENQMTELVREIQRKEVGVSVANKVTTQKSEVLEGTLGGFSFPSVVHVSHNDGANGKITALIPFRGPISEHAAKQKSYGFEVEGSCSCFDSGNFVPDNDTGLILKAEFSRKKLDSKRATSLAVKDKSGKVAMIRVFFDGDEVAASLYPKIISWSNLRKDTLDKRLFQLNIVIPDKNQLYKYDGESLVNKLVSSADGFICNYISEMMLPDGKRLIKLRFKYSSFRIGKFESLISLAEGSSAVVSVEGVVGE